MSETRKILVVAAHPDDETLGCGGTILKQARKGAEVSVLFLTNGVGARGDCNDDDIEERRNATASAMNIFQVHQFEQLDFPDNQLDSVPLIEVARAIDSFRRKVGEPDIIYTHHPGDLNVDHQVAHRAVLTVFRPQEGRPIEILLFEVASSTGWSGQDGGNFVPDCFEDISTTLGEKLRALVAYDAEMRPWPHARSLQAVEHLARWRGASVGLEAAEAFCVERLIR